MIKWPRSCVSCGEKNPNELKEFTYRYKKMIQKIELLKDRIHLHIFGWMWIYFYVRSVIKRQNKNS